MKKVSQIGLEAKKRRHPLDRRDGYDESAEGHTCPPLQSKHFQAMCCNHIE